MTVFLFHLVNFEISIKIIESKAIQQLFFSNILRNLRVCYTPEIFKSIAMPNEYINYAYK